MSEGAGNLAQDSSYLDLPAYDGVRAPRPERWAEEDIGSVLVLCPFSAEYSDFYERTLRDIIQAHTGDKTPLRMLDLRSPRLVGQALYEQIRWATNCIVDWTQWRPNVFFELGVRLACSDRDPLCIVDGSDAPIDPTAPPTALKQKEQLRELIPPVAYERADDRPRMALMHPLGAWSRRHLDGAGFGGPPGGVPPRGTFAAAQAHFRWETDPMLTPPHVEQRRTAERILGRDQDRKPERLVLFADNQAYDSQLNAAVRERWIAAWLYLRHISDGGRNEELIAVGRFTMNALRSSDEERHVELRDEIRSVLDTDRDVRRAARARRRAQQERGDRG